MTILYRTLNPSIKLNTVSKKMRAKPDEERCLKIPSGLIKLFSETAKGSAVIGELWVTRELFLWLPIPGKSLSFSNLVAGHFFGHVVTAINSKSLSIGRSEIIPHVC